MNNSEKYLPQKLDYLLDLTLFYQHDCKSPYFLQKDKSTQHNNCATNVQHFEVYLHFKFNHSKEHQRIC